MKKFWKSIFDIRKGEIALTLLMFSNYYLILVTYYFLKPARDSLFLTKASPQELPLVFILTALVAAPVVSFYSRAGNKLKLNHLSLITIGVIVINLFILRWLIQIDQPWVYYVFYAWVSIYGALTTSQFWLLANVVYDATQAKRIFSILGLGGILGAFTGGEVTGFIVKTLGVSTENLLFFCIGFLVISALMIILIWSIKTGREDPTPQKAIHRKRPQEKMGQLFKGALSSKHLKLIIGIIAMTMMVASFVDYQFKVVSKASFSDTADLTAFLGKFYGRLSLVSLFLQLFFAYRFIRWLGVGGIIMFLPIALGLGSAVMFLVPGLTAAILLRGGDGALKYSLDKTGRELLMLPVPLELKRRTKIFIDIFVDRWFRGLAGAILLLCTLVFGLSIKWLSPIIFILLAIWLVMVFMMRKEYVNSFRTALEKRTIDLSEIRSNINDPSTVNSLIVSLASTNDRQVVYALELLASVKDVELKWPLKPLLNHRSSEIRLKALEVLHTHGDKTLITDVEKLLDDMSTEVRCEAIFFLCRQSECGITETLKKYLHNPNRKIVTAAVACIAKHGTESEKKLLTEDIVQELMSDESRDGEMGRILLARVFGTIDTPIFNTYLDKLLNDSSQKVVKEAIDSIGQAKDIKYVPWLIDRLADKIYRGNARAALAAFGTSTFETLKEFLLDKRVRFIIRKNIPGVIRKIPVQESVNLLTACLPEAEPSLKYYIVKALNNLRINYPDLNFDSRQLEFILFSEAKSYYEIYHVLITCGQTGEDSGLKLLKRALYEKQQQNLEIIFRLLGLVYPPQDIYSAYQGLVSGKKLLHANAIEFLDNLLRSDVKKYIIPILDEHTPELIIQKAEELFRITRKNKEEAQAYLIEGNDNWLKACAIYSSIGTRSDRIGKLLIKAREDPDTLVSETAELVLSK